MTVKLRSLTKKRSRLPYLIWDTSPHIKNYLVPNLSSNDTEEALIEAVGLFTDNGSDRRTKAVLEGERRSWACKAGDKVYCAF